MNRGMNHTVHHIYVYTKLYGRIIKKKTLTIPLTITKHVRRCIHIHSAIASPNALNAFLSSVQNKAFLPK